MRYRTPTGATLPYVRDEAVYEPEAGMRRSLTETFDAHRASTPVVYVEVLQVYLGIALIVLGMVLGGIAVLRVLSL